MERSRETGNAEKQRDKERPGQTVRDPERPTERQRDTVKDGERESKRQRGSENSIHF